MTLKELARNAIREGDPATLATLREELAKTGRALAAIHASGAVYERVATFEDELARGARTSSTGCPSPCRR